jgi:phosphoglucosamine mutase
MKKPLSIVPRKLFGTDGIRGIANEHPMTPELALQLGRAVAFVAGRGKSHVPRILIGKDTRLSGYMLEQAMASGVCAMGGRAWLPGPMPTPAIAHLTVSMRADAGIVISASHNPYQDNGIKVFGADGFKLPDRAESEIEQLIDNDGLLGKRSTGPGIGRAEKLEDARGRYVVFLKQTFPHDLSLDGVRIVVDAAHGAAYRVAPLVLQELGAHVTAIGVKPNGVNINKDSGALHPENVRAEVVKRGAVLGIALDGDADRVILVDEKGQIVDGDQVLAMCATRMVSDGTLRVKTVVATVMSNLGLEHALTRCGAKLVRTQVGDRYVVEAMRAGGYNLGGEQSGHLVFLDHASTGDGMLGALQVLARQAVERTRRASDASRSSGARERHPGCAQALGGDATARGPHGEDFQDARRRGARPSALERYRGQAPHHAGGPSRRPHSRMGQRPRKRSETGLAHLRDTQSRG